MTNASAPGQVSSEMYEPVRILPWHVLALAALAMVILQLIFIEAIFPSGLLSPITSATAGLIRPTLLANLAIFIVVVVVVLMGCGRLRPRDLGFGGAPGFGGTLAVAVCATLGVWIAINLAEMLAARKASDLRFDTVWTQRPIGTIGLWIAVTFGTALLEEVLFRGVLPLQFAIRLERLELGKRTALVLAFLIAQLVFALAHLPALLSSGSTPLGRSLWALFFAGCALSLLYRASGNLALCIGIHGLADAPSLLVADRWSLPDHQTFVVSTSAAVSLACIGWRHLRQRNR